MKKELIKQEKSILGGEVVPDTKEYKNLMKSLKKFEKTLDLKDKEEVEIKNPVNGNTALVTLDRTGTTDDKLAIALNDSTMNREQKDSMLSLYLFERGKESSSFIMDLFASKGRHTKETQAFKSQVRFDLTAMANFLAVFFSDTKTQIYKDLEDKTNSIEIFKTLADRFESASEKLIEMMNKITEDRMRENGYGIYISKDGKPYSIFDEGVDEVIKKDKETND